MQYTVKQTHAVCAGGVSSPSCGATGCSRRCLLHIAVMARPSLPYTRTIFEDLQEYR